MTGDGSGPSSPPGGGAIERAFPLTHLQEGMLYHHLRAPGSGLYHGQCVARLEGPLDEVRFREAWRRASARHEALRTFFAWERRPRPVQVVLREASLEPRMLDWTALPADERRARWEALVEGDRRRPFDLGRAPLARLVVARLEPGVHELLWSIHHAVLDGWSAFLVLGEVLEDHHALEEDRVVERAPPPSYARFVGWLQEQDHQAAETFWRRELSGLEGPTPLPCAGGEGASTERRTAARTLTPAETSELRAAAARMRVTLNTLTVAAWALLLGRHAGARDVVFGVTVSERPSAIPGVARAAGLYLSTLPTRVELPEGERVQGWLAGLQRRLSEARAHGAPGLSRIRRWSEVGGGPLFRSLVVFESFPESVAGVGKDGTLRARSISVTGPSDLPLALVAYPGERLVLELVHDPAQVSVEEVEGLLREVGRTLRELGRSGGHRTVAELLAPVIGPEGPDDRSPQEAPPEVLSREEAGEPGAGAEARDVLVALDDQARRHPDRVALRAGRVHLSYRDCRGAASALARRLEADGVRPGSRVGILADRSVEAVVAMLGVLEAGCAYLPLDPRLPLRRLQAMASRTARVVAGPGQRHRLEALSPPSLVLDLVGAAPEETDPQERPDRPATPEGTAYVILTSGSTGEPKGVVVGRRQLAWSTAARFVHYPEPPGTFLLLSPLSVDSSVAGLYWTLCAGGTLVLPGERAEQDPEALSRLVEEAGVTHTLLLPSLYRAILEQVDPARLRSLRWVGVAGERCPRELVHMHAAALPGVPLHNEYGPSEATVWATVDELTLRPDGPVTIGLPVPGARIHLLRPDGRDPVPPGEVGEICIAGPGVADGYLDRPDLTARCFVEEPGRPGARMYRTGDRGRWREDGRLEFLGRQDGQVKIRGYRVETGEVERVLESHPAVSEAVVIVSGGGVVPEVDRLVEGLLLRSDHEVERLLGAVGGAGS